MLVVVMVVVEEEEVLAVMLTVAVLVKSSVSVGGVVRSVLVGDGAMNSSVGGDDGSDVGTAGRETVAVVTVVVTEVVIGDGGVTAGDTSGVRVKG